MRPDAKVAHRRMADRTESISSAYENVIMVKELSSSSATGGSGHIFESRVQAFFVTLMLARGFAPYLPRWPIVEIQLQTRIDGFCTDDLLVVVQNNKERRKLLGNIKCSMKFTKSSDSFGDVIQSAWNDFNNPDVFVKGKDVIALITGLLNRTDKENVSWLLDQAKYVPSANIFFRRVKTATYRPAKCEEKLQAIQHHLKNANGSNDVSKEELHNFLKHFYLLDCDLDREDGFFLSLLHSHISQFHPKYPQWVWSRIVNIVQQQNKHAGTITRDNFPKDVLKVFEPKMVVKMPEKFQAVQEKGKPEWAKHPHAVYLAQVALIGQWDDRRESDKEAIARLHGISYDDWLQKAREILNFSDSPLSVKGSVWKVVDRYDIWKWLAPCVLDKDLDRFQSVAVAVLKEPDPAFNLPVNERHMAKVYGAVPQHSYELRKGIAEGLAILGSQPGVCSKCSQGKVEITSTLSVREIFSDADHTIWGNLNDMLPALAEAAPDEFLKTVEKTLRVTPCPFDQLFAQEGGGLLGRNYITGLPWALEGLAWDEDYFVRACTMLGALDEHDPGGQWANRPFNSLVTILLPWFPQTRASIAKRRVAIETLLAEYPDKTFELVIQLLPDQHQSSAGTHKPQWRKIVPHDWKKDVTPEDYWEQVYFYADIAVDAAGVDANRLSKLIDQFDSLPPPAFDKLIETLGSISIAELPEDQRILLWDHLTKFAKKHRQYAHAKWALSDERVTCIEKVTEPLTPKNLFALHKHLFTDHETDFYDPDGDLEEQQEKFEERKKAAVAEIFQQGGIQEVARFAETVASPYQVGYALGVIEDESIEQFLFPSFLDMAGKRKRDLVKGFVWKRYYNKSWQWCDSIDRSNWTPKQVGCFLTCLPFIKGTWDRASKWLKDDQSEYWSRTDANGAEAIFHKCGLDDAVVKLIDHGRPHAAINCLYYARNKQPVNVSLCVRALLEGTSSREPVVFMDRYRIANLTEFLQSKPSVAKEHLYKIEWAYISLLCDDDIETEPKFLGSRLANDPEFFCDVIKLVYRSKNEEKSSQKHTGTSQEEAIKAYKLLNKWKTCPGLQEDGTFNAEAFNKWLLKVRALCEESGRLEVAFTHIGNVLIHAPSDPDGLWIHRNVASALNSDEPAFDDMRSGFDMGETNARGIHWVDPTGKPEKELAEKYRDKAEALENAGFHRFAVTLKDLAKYYEQQAENIIADANKG